MIKKVIYFCVFMFACSVWSQNFEEHRVEKGETITQIALKYNVTPYDIYQLNPEAKSGLKLGSILLMPKKGGNKETLSRSIPPKEVPKETFSSAITHKVEPKETLYGIEKKYAVSDEALKKANPELEKGGLQIGQILVIPSSAGSKTRASTSEKSATPEALPKEKKANKTAANSATSNPGKDVYHVVLPKETKYSVSKQYGISIEELERLNPELIPYLSIGYKLKISQITSHDVLPKETRYSISKKYGISIGELERLNPEIVPNLPIDYRLKVKGEAPKKYNISEVEPQKETPKPEHSNPAASGNYVDYEVKPKETLYGLSKMSGLTQEEFIKLNPDLAHGVEIGMIIKMPSTSSFAKAPVAKKEYATLSKKSSSNQRKKLVLLLPFNLADGASATSSASRLRNDKFLNMTLDFYSGALMAIDSARSIGISVDVSIFDSQETKNSSTVSNLIQSEKLDSADAIIGPFYQANVEKIAELLQANRVPVISPLSKEDKNSFENLYQSMPTTDDLRNAVFDYMNAKGGNIIAVVDSKKESIKQYIEQNHREVKFANLQDNGSLSVESLKNSFVSNKINYVILASTNTGMIKATMNAMMNTSGNYTTQLVILEPNETLSTDEISFESLARLKLLYPTITREDKSDKMQSFEKKYKKINKITPNMYVTRGFDVTFDTMMRLSQNKTFEQTVNAVATEEISNRFEYYDKEGGGYVNKGVYIMYYDTDLTIKEAR